MAAAAGLHQDILARIFLLLSCIADCVRASTVNKHWRRVALQNPSQLPWLLRPSTARTDSYRIFGGLDDPRPPLFDLGRGPRFCGSAPGGWFVISSRQQQWRGHGLLNLRTGERVALPDRVRIPLDSGVITCPMMIRAAVMSAAPPSAACFVAAITSSQTNMAFWRPGMDCWLSAPVGPTPRNAQDLTYHDGWFCAVDSDDGLVSYKPEIGADGSSLTIRHHDYKLVGHRTQAALGEIVSRYLLPSASGADLLMVKRYVAPAKGGTWKFQVYRLQEGQPASWGLYQMTGQVLFVGRACSKAFDMGHAGCPGYIYFLDDVYPGGPHSVLQQNEYPCADTGGWRYSVPGEIEDCLPWAPPSDTSPCICQCLFVVVVVSSSFYGKLHIQFVVCSRNRHTSSNRPPPSPLRTGQSRPPDRTLSLLTGTKRHERSSIAHARHGWILRSPPAHAMDTVFSLRFASPPVPATGMLLKVDSSGRLRALSTAYSLTVGCAMLSTGCSFYTCWLQPL
ncbi:hypothetical protein ZWY2020_051806 [Hordeum vulgare]|nr:hypothetical protein ZWY2020_051806 [Hordeum vulgare]